MFHARSAKIGQIARVTFGPTTGRKITKRRKVSKRRRLSINLSHLSLSLIMILANREANTPKAVKS